MFKRNDSAVDRVFFRFLDFTEKCCAIYSHWYM